MEQTDCLVTIIAHEITMSEAIAAVKEFLQQEQASDGMLTELSKLHAALYHRWARMCDLPTASYVALVVANQLTTQLRRTLLDMHVMDALDDMQDIVQCLIGNGQYFASPASVMPLVTDVLLPVAVMFSWRSDHDQRDRLIKRIEERSATCYGIRQGVQENGLLRYSGDQDKGSFGSWDQFYQLPARFDERKLQSKSGRVFIDVANQVVAQQQYSLAKIRSLLCDGHYKEEVEEDCTLEQMCDLAFHALGYVTKQCSDEQCIHTGDMHEDDTLRGLELNVVADDRSLEDHLRNKRQYDQSKHEISSPAKHKHEETDTGTLTVIEQLVALWGSVVSDSHDMDGLLLSVQQELLSISDMEALSVHVSFLLCAHQRSGYTWSSSFASDIERQVQKIFNSLASDDVQENEHVRSLTVLAAFSPARVTYEILHGASLSSQHHTFYMKVLHELPLLVEWKTHDSHPTTEFTHRARQVIKDLVSDEDRFEIRSLAFLDFFSAVSAFDTSDMNLGALLSMDSWIQDVMSPVYSRLTMNEANADASGKTTSVNVCKYFQFLYEWTKRAVSSSQASWKLHSTQDLFSLILEIYTEMSQDVSLTTSKQLDLILLTLKNVMEMIVRCENPVLPPLRDDVWSLLDVRCLELVSPLCPAEYSRSDVWINKVIDFVRDKNSDKRDTLMTSEDAANAIERLIWRILWNSMYSSQLISSLPFVHSMFSNEEMWEMIDSVARIDTETFSGPYIIRREVLKMLLTCGSSLFVVVYECLLSFLIKFDEEANGKQDANQLTIPRFVAKPQEVDESIWNMHIDCAILPAHYVTNMVIRAWREQTSESAVSCEGFVNLVSHVLECNNRAVTSSLSSLFGLLVCFRQLCFTAAFASERSRDCLDRHPFVQSQLNLALLRLLHLIGRSDASHAAEAFFSAHFIACWLSILPESSYDEASRFLQQHKLRSGVSIVH